MFKESFKYYKAKCPPPDLSAVLDLHNNNTINQSRVNKIQIQHTEHFPGYIPPTDWEIYEICDAPGLIYIKNPFTQSGERFWTVRCLKDYTKKPNRLNIDDLKLIPEESDWWEYAKKDPTVLKKLRWSTFGYQHNWNSKVYSEAERTPFPNDLKEMCSYLSRCLGFGEFSAEAAIVNFYHFDSTLAGHTDHSEIDLEAPLFSFSFGNTAIFLLGGKTLNEKPIALYIHNGDVIVMSKESRLCYHGVPKILNNISENLNKGNGNLGEDNLIEDCMDEKFWEQYKNYMKTSRINLNVRQVLAKGENSL